MPLPAILATKLLSLLLFAGHSLPDELPWQPSPWFDEQRLTVAAEPDVRIHVNAPLDAMGKPARATRLVIYALPNGNTIEQTLGCRMSEGLDWHFDIQHVAAQVRLWRQCADEAFPAAEGHPARRRERIVLICAEAKGLSWPNWRRSHPDANRSIARLVGEWRRRFGEADCQVTLTGHSGGGSFLFGLVEGSGHIPAYVDRIAFLDANYSYDAAMHQAKLARWLAAGDARRLIVLAYDDREITYQGKKVVGPDGGTFRATRRMRESLDSQFDLHEAIKPPFHETRGLGGRIRFYVHPNPENKILHTALVGEMNGLVHIATLGTPQEEKWGTFGGPRAYTQWVQPKPEAAADIRPAATSDPTNRAAPGRALPPRPAAAVGGRQFLKGLQGLGLDQREAAILREITAGNFPTFLRRLRPVPVRGTIKRNGAPVEITALIEVMPDYLAVGSDDDFVRMPMTPQTAQRIADVFGCVLPTRKLVDAIDAAAEVLLAPHPLTREREAVGTFLAHHQIIERQRGNRPLGQLLTGIKKDVVLTPRLFERPERLAIYGWRKPNGEPIQPLSIVHHNRYVDYSHGVRLVHNCIEVDGEILAISELLADTDRCGIVSDEGPVDPPRYRSP